MSGARPLPAARAAGSPRRSTHPPIGTMSWQSSATSRNHAGPTQPVLGMVEPAAAPRPPRPGRRPGPRSAGRAAGTTSCASARAQVLLDREPAHRERVQVVVVQRPRLACRGAWRGTSPRPPCAAARRAPRPGRRWWPRRCWAARRSRACRPGSAGRSPRAAARRSAPLRGRPRRGSRPRTRRRPAARRWRRARSAPATRSATSRSTSSPAAWPRVSLMSLKWSRSR